MLGSSCNKCMDIWCSSCILNVLVGGSYSSNHPHSRWNEVGELHFSVSNLSAFRDRGVPKPTSECAACPSPDGSRGRARRGESEVAGGGRERGGNPAAFMFVPRPGRVRLQ
jgi:hypothetical protein